MRRRRPAAARVRDLIGIAAPLALLMAPVAEAGSARLAVGGYVPAARSLEIAQQISSGASGQDALTVVITAPGNGSAGYELILRDESATADAGRDVTFDGRAVDLKAGAVMLAAIDGVAGRGPDHRLRVPAGDAEGHMTLVLRSR